MAFIHKFKGTISNFFATPLETKLDNLSQAIRDNDLSAAESLFAEVLLTIEDLENELRSLNLKLVA